MDVALLAVRVLPSVPAFPLLLQSTNCFNVALPNTEHRAPDVNPAESPLLFHKVYGMGLHSLRAPPSHALALLLLSRHDDRVLPPALLHTERPRTTCAVLGQLLTLVEFRQTFTASTSQVAIPSPGLLTTGNSSLYPHRTPKEDVPSHAITVSVRANPPATAPSTTLQDN
ncbi:hypothetical protein C8R44DRAFT_990339 [Mycena epipterygia]|nr:hypothetical protein C8R44DRAFT_990339 [Mycena epipterygia]